MVLNHQQLDQVLVQDIVVLIIGFADKIMDKNLSNNQEIVLFDLIIIVLSVYVLLALMVDTFFTLPIEVSHMLNIVDDFICIVFLFDFVRRFYKSENKFKFMKWGWIDLISSIPTFGFARAGRVLRLVRLLRVLRAFRSTKVLAKYILRNKTHGTFAIAGIISILMIIFSSIAILNVETSPNSNIKTAEDALWWSFTTITTVGYGDRYPVTTEGRIVAAFLMITGVGFFGTFTGFIASWFVQQPKNDEIKNE